MRCIIIGLYILLPNILFLRQFRDRFFFFLLIGLIILFGLSHFAATLAITENREIQLALLGAGLRLFAIAISSLFVIANITREFNDKEVALIFSFPCPRLCYYLGKLSGFSFTFLILTVLITAALTLYSATGPLFIWSVFIILRDCDHDRL